VVRQDNGTEGKIMGKLTQHVWDRDAYKDSVGIFEGGIPLERHRHKWGE